MMKAGNRIPSLLAAGLTFACSNSPSIDRGREPPSGGGDGATGRGGSLSINLGDGVGTGGTNPAGDLATCATSSAEVALTPLDMALGVDTSYSMDFENKWV